MSFPAEILTTYEQSILSTTQIRSSEGLDYFDQRSVHSSGQQVTWRKATRGCLFRPSSLCVVYSISKIAPTRLFIVICLCLEQLCGEKGLFWGRIWDRGRPGVVQWCSKLYVGKQIVGFSYFYIIYWHFTEPFVCIYYVRYHCFYKYIHFFEQS